LSDPSDPRIVRPWTVPADPPLGTSIAGIPPPLTIAGGSVAAPNSWWISDLPAPRMKLSLYVPPSTKTVSPGPDLASPPSMPAMVLHAVAWVRQLPLLSGRSSST
jgi:hypothetical protein